MRLSSDVSTNLPVPVLRPVVLDSTDDAESARRRLWHVITGTIVCTVAYAAAVIFTAFIL